MNIVFHSRNANLAEDFRGIVSEKLNTLSRFGVVIDEIKVEITHEQNPHHGKSDHHIALSTHGSGPFLRAEATGFNDTAAFDKAVDGLELQLRKTHERSRDHLRDSLRERDTVNE